MADLGWMMTALPHVAAKREHPGRVYGHGSRAYSGPRDVAHRRSRPALTRETLRGWRRSALVRSKQVANGGL